MALVQALQYSNVATSVSEGPRSFNISVMDAGRNISAAAQSSVVLNAVAPNKTSTTPVPLVTVDANGDGALGDVFLLNFTEAVDVSRITTTNLVLAANGAGNTPAWGAATIEAVSPITIANGLTSTTYAKQFKVTQGAGTVLTTGNTITLAAANVVDAAGTVASGSVQFTLTDIVAPSTPDAPLNIANDNAINGSEATSSATTMLYTASQVSSGDQLLVYLNGELVKTITNASTSNTFDLANLWGSDGVKILTTRLLDTAGNLSAFSTPKLVTVDTSVKDGIANMTWTDSNASGGLNAGDTVVIQLNEALNLTSASLNSSVFGSGYSLVPMGGVNSTVSTTNGGTPVSQF